MDLKTQLELLRRLWKDYKRVQKVRVMLENSRRGANLRSRIAADVFWGWGKMLKGVEYQIEKAMLKILEDIPMWKDYLKDVDGIGVVSASFLLGFLGLASVKARNVNDLFGFCGLYPYEGKLVRMRKGEKVRFKPIARATLIGRYGIAHKLARYNEKYRKLYEKYYMKELEKVKSSKWAEKRALILVAKKFIREFWRECLLELKGKL